MSATATSVVQVQLDGGASIYAEVVNAEEGLSDNLQASFDEVKKVIEGLGTEIWTALQAISPDKATVEFDLDLTFKGGILTCLLVKNSADVTLKVTLEWDKAAATSPAPS